MEILLSPKTLIVLHQLISEKLSESRQEATSVICQKNVGATQWPIFQWYQIKFDLTPHYHNLNFFKKSTQRALLGSPLSPPKSCNFIKLNWVKCSVHIWGGPLPVQCSGQGSRSKSTKWHCPWAKPIFQAFSNQCLLILNDATWPVPCYRSCYP